MKYFMTFLIFLVFSTTSVANDHVPVGKLPKAITQTAPEFVDIAFTSTDNIAAVYWSNGETMYYRAAVVTKRDMKSIKRIAKRAGYLVQTAIYDPLEGIELISIIDNNDVERFYVRYFPIYAPPIIKGGK